MARKKEALEFRYYEIPYGEPLLALYGDAWAHPYGYDDHDCSVLDLHFHNLMEIGCCHAGTGLLTLKDTSYKYANGTISVIPKNYPHTTTGDNPTGNHWEYLFIDVEKSIRTLYPTDDTQAELLLSRINKNAFFTTTMESPELSALIQAILREMSMRREMYADSVNGLLRSLFIEIARRQPAPVEDTAPQSTDSLQITRALEYVGDHFWAPLRVEDLASLCNMSETNFRRVFIKCMKIAPIDYINQVRVHAACERLRTSDDPIAEIAQKCGFSSIATFNRNFRRYAGTTPKEWRKSPDTEHYDNH
ncbi:MAG: AraC family transcriptional regulator [Lachnospiraceae bacterium]|nr:AraC family transcriptional regulator [Lachnospiraceae bacterium]